MFDKGFCGRLLRMQLFDIWVLGLFFREFPLQAIGAVQRRIRASRRPRHQPLSNLPDREAFVDSVLGGA